ncbi:MAG: nitrite reductase small subunit NirD [Nevskia sp.]|nr:nitrite reductase small subunit NirD [Nevskia sp.]
MSARILWRTVCALDEIWPDSGVAALIGEEQIAVFRLGQTEEVYALGNRDPFSQANVLARGITGDVGGEPVVASPVYKQHFRLRDGVCVEDAEVSVPVYPVRVYNGAVQLGMAMAATPRQSRQRLVMIGNGMAGMRVIEDLLRIAPDAYDITIFGAEPHGNYNRILLSPVLAGEKRFEDIVLHDLAWYARQGITLHSGDPVVAIDRRRRLVRTRDGVEAGYDRLLLATGSTPNRLPIPGKDLPGVITFRDVADVALMIDTAKQRRNAVVIGGGVLGLEAANGLLQQGMEVTVVHSHDVLMERQLDAYASSLLRRSLESRGIKFVLGAKTAAVEGTERATGLRFADGSGIAADLVVMTAGVTPNAALAKEAGLQCGRGVLVDDTLQTYDPRVYAVGECVQHRNATYGLVAPLWEQARVCAAHLAGFGHLRYSGSLLSTSLKVTGIELFSAGNFAGGEGCEVLILRDPEAGIYKRIVLKDHRVCGALLFGDARDGAWYLELMQDRRDISSLRDRLLFGRAYADVQAAA